MVNQNSILQTTTDWTLSRKYLESFKQMALVKSIHNNSAEKRAKLYYEFVIFSKEKDPWMLQPIAIEYVDKQYALLFEDFNGVPLKSLLDKNLSIHHFLKIAVELANACFGLHQKNILYQNLNPQHILVHPTSFQVKLLSSEYITSWDTELPIAAENPYERYEQLPYFAPEQTGRLNLEIDHRSDLYALGVIFYEMLSGQLPFRAQDSVELIYEIITKKPRAIRSLNSEIAPIIANVIEKLLEKNPENRYQSARGLKEDLQRIQEKMLLGEEQPIFALGQDDVNLNKGLISTLYGRTEQLNTLKSIFKLVQGGDKKIAFISGQSGYGKSSLVKMLKRDVAASKGYYVVSKYDQLKQETTFAPMIQPLRSLLKQVYLEGGNSVALWRTLFKEIDLVITKQLMLLIPELRWFIGKDVQVKSDERENTRQLHAFIFTSIQKILITFAMQKRPVIWFIDDLQWADGSSIDMLRQIYEQHRAGYFFVIGSYRPENIVDFKELISWQNQLQDFTSISLQLLDEVEVRTWIADSLNDNSNTIAIFAKQLHRVTKGNPLFVKEAFRTYQKNRTIFFDIQLKKWQLDLKNMNEAVSNEALLSFIENRIDSLADETREILQIVACFGKQFEFSTLLKTLNIPAYNLLQHIGILVEQGFLLSLDAHFKWATTYEHEGILQALSLEFQFVHDRIQQVTYQSLTEEERAHNHFAIGKVLTENNPAIEESNHLNEAVKHYNYCTHLLSDKEKQSLALWNFRLGLNTKKAGLFENAIYFLTTSLELLPSDHWQSLRKEAFEIHAHLGECEYLVGHYELSEIHLNAALKNATSIVEKLTLYNLKTLLYIESDKHMEGLNAGLEGLRVGHIKIDDYPTKLQLAKEFLLLKAALQNKSDAKLLNLPKIKNEETDLLIQIIINMAGSAYLLNVNLTGFLLMKGVRLLLEHGGNTESGIAYINYAMFLNAGFGDVKGASRFGQLAVKLADEQDSIYIKGRIYFVYGVFINHLTKSYDNTIYYISKAQQYSQDLNLHHLVSASSCFICTTQLIRGDSLQDLADEIARQRHAYSTNASTLSIDFLHELNLWMDVLREPNVTADWDYPFTLQDEESIMIMHYAVRLKMSFLLQEMEQGFSILDVLHNPVKNSYTLLVSPLYYFYRALWQIEKIHQKKCNREEKKAFLNDIQVSIRKLKKWSKHAPQNYEHLYVLLLAENCRLKSLDGEAVLYYDRAIQLASIGLFTHDTAIACERAASYYASKRDVKTANEYILRGIHKIRLWGAETVALLWEALYEVHNDTLKVSGNTAPLTFDMQTVFETTQSLSKEIRMDDLLRKMLFALLKHAGADIGYFIHNDNDNLNVLAKAEASDIAFTLYKDQKIHHFPEKMQAIVRYVMQSEEYLIIKNVQEDKKFKGHSLLTKSVLCLPIHHKGELIAILFLENTLITNAFSSTQLDLLKMISGQIAVSLENAQIYEDLEQRVEERTKELAEMNSHLKKVNDQLEMNELERKKLLHSISHELRSPITSTLGYIEMILDDVVKDEQQQRKYLHRSKERLLALNVLIQDLFDLANLEAGRIEYAIRQVHVTTFYEQFAYKYEEEIKKAGLSYSTNNQMDMDAYVLIDESRIEQVITNLIVNAIKFTKKGSIHFSVTVQEQGLICSIEDSGIGIPEKDMAFIFDSYYSASNIKKSTDSHGIGLAICKQIIAQHDGEIFVDSTENQGSRFSFILPIITLGQ
ncbi:MAG: AAA family ATPase [Lysinibacillus sp.]